MSEAADDPSVKEDARRWLIVNGRRWRRTDPCLPNEVVEALTSHLGRARSGVRKTKTGDDAEALRRARQRVGWAKTGLGERGPYWWHEREATRIQQARDMLDQLEA